MDPELVSAVLAMDDAETLHPVVTTTKKKFVAFIDTQADFMLKGGKLYVEGADALIGPLNNFAHGLSPDEIEGVLFTFDTHNEAIYPTTEEAKQFPPHCIYATPGWENVINPNVLNPKVPLYTLEKDVFNMWSQLDAEDEVFVTGVSNDTVREEFFDDLKAKGIEDVVIVGVAADFCVKWAADGFLSRGFNVEIPRSLTAGIVRDIDTVAREDYAGVNLTITD